MILLEKLVEFDLFSIFTRTTTLAFAGGRFERFVACGCGADSSDIMTAGFDQVGQQILYSEEGIAYQVKGVGDKCQGELGGFLYSGGLLYRREVVPVVKLKHDRDAKEVLAGSCQEADAPQKCPMMYSAFELLPESW